MKSKKIEEQKEFTIVNSNNCLTFDEFVRIFPDGKKEFTACLDSVIDFDKLEHLPACYNTLQSAVDDVLDCERKKVYVAIPLASNLTIVITNKDYFLSKRFLHE